MTKITRAGTWPILKYTCGGDSGWHATIMLDDNAGNLVVVFDSYVFHHFWNSGGRGQKSLRRFLAGVDRGYIGDKLSYGRDRWDDRAANEELTRDMTEAFGHTDDWPDEVVECLEWVDGCSTQEAFQAILLSNEDIMSKIDITEKSYGVIFENREVKNFLDKFWEPLTAFWKEELLREPEKVSPQETN